jgi:hypothetical protein
MTPAGNTGHPFPNELALFSAEDLPSLTSWRIGRHVKRCSECEQQVVLFRSANRELQREAATETLTGFEAIADWARLEREMMGNIAVGLDAAHCIENVGRRRALLFRVAFAAAFTLLFVIGWMTHIPREQTGHLVSSLNRLFTLNRTQATGPILRTTLDGITVGAQGATLTILHPPSAVIGVSGAYAVSARYVDADTGEVTITKVYAH